MHRHWTPLLLFSAVLISTACETPYQPLAMSGGYTDFEAQPGVHYVAFEARSGTSYPTVRRYWHRRAAEVCGGPDSYMRLWTFDRGDALASETDNQVRPDRPPTPGPESSLDAVKIQDPDGEVNMSPGNILVEGYIVCTGPTETPAVSQRDTVAPLCSSWDPCEQRRETSCASLGFFDAGMGEQCDRGFETCMREDGGEECFAAAEGRASGEYRAITARVVQQLDLRHSICRDWVERGGSVGDPDASQCRGWARTP
jgi:hypothetical protein